MLRGATWCCVVLRGAAWCCVALRGAAWCCVVLRRCIDGALEETGYLYLCICESPVRMSCSIFIIES